MTSSRAGRLPIGQLDLGLNTAHPSTSLIPGQLQVAENVVVNDRELRTTPGFTRVTKTATDDHSYILNGQYMRGRIRDTGSVMALPYADYTVEVFFRLDRWPQRGSGSIMYSTLICKDEIGVISGLPDWHIYIRAVPGNGLQAAMEVNGATTFSSYGLFEVGDFCHLAITVDGPGVDTKLYLSKVSDTLVEDVGTTGAPLSMPSQDNGDIVIGTSSGQVDVYNTGDILDLDFVGVIQEIRVWENVQTLSKLQTYHTAQLTDAEAAAETDLKAYYRLTGSNTNVYFFEPDKGTAGDGAGEAPYLAIERRDASWKSTGHPYGNPTLSVPCMDFDGRLQGLEVADSYLYRENSPDEAGKLNITDRFVISMRVSIRELVTRATLFHWVPVTSDTFVTTLLSETTVSGQISSVSSAGNVVLEIIDDGGDFKFRFVVYHDTGNATSVVHSTVLSADTDYTVTAGVGFGASTSTLGIIVNDAAVVTQASAALDLKPDASANSPEGANSKYWMSIGRAIRRVKRDNGFPFDPNAVIREYDFDRSFDGELRQVLIATPDITNQNVMSNEGYYIHKFNQGNPGREAIQNFGWGLRSFWRMWEGKGSTIEDFGNQINPIFFQEDPKHAWGRSAITTNEKSVIRALLDHNFRQESGTNGIESRFIAIAGGSAYDIRPGTGSVNWIDDGFRNDDQNLISTTPIPDGHLLCAGGRGRNYLLWKDQIYPADLLPPSGQIPFGLSDQNNKDAAGLVRGTYGYTFTFYSAKTGQESPVGEVISVRIRTKKANVTFGEDAEINQTHACTPFSNNKESYDLETAGTDYIIRAQGWYGAADVTSAGDPDWWEDDLEDTTPGNNPFSYHNFVFVKTNKNALINDLEAVEVDECVAIFDQSGPKVFAEGNQEGKWRICSAFVGANAFLRVKKKGSATDLIGNNTVFEFDTSGTIVDDTVTGGAPASPVPMQGTGESNHGLKLPVSLDPQVTHLRIWRTNTDGAQYRLIAELPNGTESYVDSLPDIENIGEVLDVTKGSPPACKFVADFNRRRVYANSFNAPQRVYFSEDSDPYNVPAQNVVDLNDGDSLEITGLGLTESALLLFKNNTTFVAVENQSVLFPFTIATRLRDVGCTSHFGIVPVQNSLMFPSDKGVYAFDTSFPQYLSDAIENLWESQVAAEYRAQMVGVQDRLNDQVIWFYADGSWVDQNSAQLNNRALVYNYEVGAWTELKDFPVVAAAVIPDQNEEDRVYFSDAQGYINRWALGTNFGSEGTTREVTVQAGAATTTSCVLPAADGTAFPEGYRGLTLTFEDSDGTRETVHCVSDTAGAVSFLPALSFTPTSGDTVYVGLIEATAQLGDLDMGAPDRDKTVTDTFIRQTLETVDTGTYTLFWRGQGGQHYQDAPEETATLANNENTFELQATAAHGRAFTLGFRVRDPDVPVRWRDLVIIFKAPDRGAYR